MILVFWIRLTETNRMLDSYDFGLLESSQREDHFAKKLAPIYKKLLALGGTDYSIFKNILLSKGHLRWTLQYWTFGQFGHLDIWTIWTFGHLDNLDIWTFGQCPICPNDLIEYYDLLDNI
ncbi:hypothetical protein C2G38_2186540 [Gigaspora rosea]|uniref:Uncharacterized protein n=1 Tax=Gigaspora rosea TaxID=44941 RepID=A0A397V8S0_9GLOM|nr:hypothetical protein C2G38_2186540 [Gigaspora rosea]